MRLLVAGDGPLRADVTAGLQNITDLPTLEGEVFGRDLNIVKRDTAALAELSDADCAAADGLMIMGFAVTGADLVLPSFTALPLRDLLTLLANKQIPKRS